MKEETNIKRTFAIVRPETSAPRIHKLKHSKPMITFLRIARYLGAEPFRPFRICLASGRTFEIRHPEMVQVGRNTMTIFTFLTDEGEKTQERQVEVSLLLTESVEPLDAKTLPEEAE